MNNTFPQFMPIMPEQTSNPSKSNMTVYIDSSPYPEVEGAPNPATVALLKEDYAGVHGELTAITQYVFQNGRSTKNETFANSILQIAIIEMIHLDMLGDAIATLGGNPSFDNGQYYWNASNINYAADFREMLKADIAAERTAIANYTKHIALTNNPSVKALLMRIIKDEQLHLQFFTETLASVQ